MNALTPFSPAETTDLAEAINRARALFASGDVVLAKSIADLVYSSIQPLTKAAEKLDMREAIEACYRIQADALEVVTYSEIRVADEWDKAKGEGKTLRGRPKKSVINEDAFKIGNIGWSRDQLLKARKVRDAEKDNPGFVRRIIQDQVRLGFAPTKADIRHALNRKAGLGMVSATKEERGFQLYETPIEAMRTLLALESFSGSILEPAVGRGAIMRPLEDAGYGVLISDLVDRGVTTRAGQYQQVGDFLASEPVGEGVDIVTNPPYDDLANAFAAHALCTHKPRKMALLLNMNFMCGFDDPNRRYVMDENPPSRIYVFARRLPMMHRDGWQGPKANSQMNTAWFVWERNEDGSYGQGYPQIIRVMWDDYQTAAPLAPGAGGNVAPLTFRPPVDDEFTRETPRKELSQRLQEEEGRALSWMASRDTFELADLRKGIAVRELVAVALIADFEARGLIAVAGENQWTLLEREGAGHGASS